MKQLIGISASFLQAGDIIFNPIAKNLVRVEEVYFLNDDGKKVVDRPSYVSHINLVFSDKSKPIEFSLRYKLYILVDTEKLRIVDNTPDGVSIIELGKDKS